MKFSTKSFKRQHKKKTTKKDKEKARLEKMLKELQAVIDSWEPLHLYEK